jgi:hypothetical protein
MEVVGLVFSGCFDAGLLSSFVFVTLRRCIDTPFA